MLTNNRQHPENQHTLNFDRLAARLSALASEPWTARAPSPASTVSFDEEEQLQRDRRIEISSYDVLNALGGRASHPIDLLQNVIDEPGEYGEIVAFWKGDYDSKEWRLFSRQLSRWLGFCRLQRFARGQSAYDYWHDVWQDRQNILKIQDPDSYTGDTEDTWVHEWQINKRYGRHFVYISGQYHKWSDFVTLPDHDFASYVAKLQQRLQKHGFTKYVQPVEHEQDSWTTWAEYLGYEYWWYDKYTDLVNSLQRKNTRAWQKLTQANVLRPGETALSICSHASACRRVMEREAAEVAFKDVNVTLHVHPYGGLSRATATI